METNSPILEYRNVPDENIMSHPLVQQLSQALKISDFKIPLILKNKILMEEGNWNNHYYSADAISKAYENTDWSNRNHRDLFLDHEDKKAAEWIGEVDNIRFMGKSLLGDLIIHDLPTAIKLQSGKPKIGVSPAVKGKNDIHSNEMFEFFFDNFSIVMNPAVKTAYINNTEENIMSYKEVKNEEEVKPETSTEETPKVDPVPKKEEAETGSGEEKKEEEKTSEETTEEKPKEEEKEMSELEKREYALGLLSEALGILNKPKPTVAEVANQEMEKKISDITAKLSNVEKLVNVKDVADRRSVNAGSAGSGKTEELRATLSELKANPDLGMTKFLEKAIDGGARA